MRFSTSFLRIMILSAVSATAVGCAYVIPVDPNEPRNNEVMGDRHRPQLNNVRGKSAAVTRAQQEFAQVDSRDLPPTGAEGEREMASNDVRPIVSTPASGRRVPSENQEFQVAAMGYPDINSVPPRPALTGPDSAKERLSGVKSTLEQDRANADASKEQLSKDAAAEPSMLSDLPKTDGVVPPNDPVKSAPSPGVQPMPPAVIAPAIKPTSSNAYPQRVAVRTSTTVPGMSAAQSKRYAPDYAASQKVASVSLQPAPVQSPVVVEVPKPVEVAAVAPIPAPVPAPALAPMPVEKPVEKPMVLASAAPAPVYTSPIVKEDMNDRLANLPPLTPDSDTMVVMQPTRVSPPAMVPVQAAKVETTPMEVKPAPVEVKKTVIATPPMPMLPPPPPAASSMTSALPPATVMASAAPAPQAPVNLARSDFDPMTISDAPAASAAPAVKGDFDPLAAAAAADAAPGRPSVTTVTNSANPSYATNHFIAASRYGSRY